MPKSLPQRVHVQPSTTGKPVARYQGVAQLAVPPRDADLLQRHDVGVHLGHHLATRSGA